MVVREDIRQALIFKDFPEKYLVYARHFKEKCLARYLETTYAEDCSAMVLEEMGIVPSSINDRVVGFLEQCSLGGVESLKLYEQMVLDRGMMGTIGHYPTIFLDHEEVPVCRLRSILLPRPS